MYLRGVLRSVVYHREHLHIHKTDEVPKIDGYERFEGFVSPCLRADTHPNKHHWDTTHYR